ncbi:MAG: hypothetical protein JJ992_12510 [Planctomycetes bacterium]|nr:hypothetical protein [Planctomycetota bacterium]
MDLASKWQTASFILAMIVATSSTTVGAADEGNLLPDASFEEAENGQPTD